MTRTISSFKTMLLSCVVLLTVSTHSARSQSTVSSTVSTTVSKPTAALVPIYFGTPQENEGVCVGTGICPDDATNGGINVTFQVSADYPNTIILTFSLSQLQQIQPDQVAAFQTGSYMFAADYCLSSNPSLSSLNLPANSWILTTSNSYVQISGDVVTDYIQYSVVSN